MKRLRDWLTCFSPAVPWLITAVLILVVLMILVSALRPKAHAQIGGVQQPMFGMLTVAAPDALPTGDLFVWLKPESLIGAQGAGVTNWPDSSGWQHNVTNSNPLVQQPFITNNMLNGYSAARFQLDTASSLHFGQNNGQDFLKDQDGLTLHFVIRPLSDANSLFFHAESTNADNIRLTLERAAGADNAQIYIQGRAPDSQALQSYADLKTLKAGANFEYWSYVFWFTNATARVYRNGVLQFTKTSFIGPSATQNAADIVRIGHDGASGMQFELVEFIGYTNAQTASALASVFDYIGTKYNFYGSTNSALLASYDINALALNDGDLISSVTNIGPVNYALGADGASRPYWTNNGSIINGEGWAYFDGANTWLTNMFTTEYPQPTHLFFVSYGVGQGGSAGCVFASYDDGAGHYQAAYELNTDNILRFASPTELNAAVPELATWTVWDVVFNGTASVVRTNNVLVTAGDSGTTGRRAVVLGANAAHGSHLLGGIAYIAFYTNVLTSAASSNHVNWLGSRYGITTYTRN